MADIHVGDVGTQFVITLKDHNGVVLDVTAAITKTLTFQPPRGALTAFERAANFVTDGEDGQIYYVTQAGDLSAAGEWELQAYVELPSGAWHSDITRFDVVGNL